MDPLAQIARTILYEGYILWPYRRSAIKNQQRWTFGGVYPESFANVSGGADRSRVGTDCILEAAEVAEVTASVRFLQVVRRQVLRATGDSLVPVDELSVGEVRHLTWDEAIEREVSASIRVNPVAAFSVTPVAIAGDEVTEDICDDGGKRVGAIRRRWETITAHIELTTSPLPAQPGYPPAYRIAVAVVNDSEFDDPERTEVVRHSLVSAHAALTTDRGSFVSSFDPPPEHEQSVALCHNDGLWPVLVGEPGSSDTMLASPIILYDYPRIAPESPGDLFDGGEIDQLLVLNVLSLTDEEKREMRDTDPRAREILDRCSSLSEDQLMQLHGTVRGWDSHD